MFTDSMTMILKTKRLNLCELRNIVKDLTNVDLSVIQEIVVRDVRKEQHVYVFQGLNTFGFELPTNVKLATCATISEGTPQVLLIVRMICFPATAD